jgi:hypothetical protein
VPCLAQILLDRRVIQRGLRYFVDSLGFRAKSVNVYLQVVMLVFVRSTHPLLAEDDWDPVQVEGRLLGNVGKNSLAEVRCTPQRLTEVGQFHAVGNLPRGGGTGDEPRGLIALTEVGLYARD